jgi:S1-C subfamily serine protease
MKTTAAALVQHPGTHAGTSSGFIGVQLLPLDVNVRRQLNYVGNGVAIAGVISGSSADAAGLEPGDVIQQVNGTPVSSPSDVTAIIGKLQPGQTVTLRVWSGGTIRRVVVRVGQRPLDGM